MNNVWTVYTAIFNKLVAFIDPTLTSSSTFLENLVTDGFFTPHVSKEYLDMIHSPHRYPPKRPHDDAGGTSNNPPSPPKRQRGDNSATPPTSNKSDGTTPPRDRRPPNGINKLDGSPVDPRACCMCKEVGHKAYKCPHYDQCTCGAVLHSTKNKRHRRHDPYRCDKGPRTEQGAAALTKLKRKN